jgi:flavorubredoxin
VRRGSNGKVVELIRVANEHSDGMLVAYLPAEKVLWSADVTAVNPNPAQLAVLKAVVQTVSSREYSSWIQAHPPNPDKPLTKADVTAAVGTGTN